jgi:hypothetical protein
VRNTTWIRKLQKVIRAVWHEIKTKDVRDAIQLSKLVDNVDDVMIAARTIMKYKSGKMR